MNSFENIDRGRGPVEQMKEYEAPKVTTFGSVAKLTMGALSRHTDGNGTQTHDRGNNP